MTTHNLYALSNSVATRITPAGTHSGMDITLQNANLSGWIYVGGEGVTGSSYGYRLAPGHAISFELPGRDDLHAIAEINGSNLAVISIGLEGQD
jgi:hypothetical protein